MPKYRNWNDEALLKSVGESLCGFDSHLWHQIRKGLMQAPKSKYDIRCYRFGEVMSKHFLEFPFEESYWQYRVLKRGKKHPQYYAEEEVEAMDKAANIITVH